MVGMAERELGKSYFHCCSSTFPDKDAVRTDRALPFYEGDNNPNTKKIFDILMTYCMYNFDLGEYTYVLFVDSCLMSPVNGTTVEKISFKYIANLEL